MNSKVLPALLIVTMISILSLSPFPLSSAVAGLDDAYNYASEAESKADEAYDYASEASNVYSLEEAQDYASQAMEAAEEAKEAANNVQSEIDNLR